MAQMLRHKVDGSLFIYTSALAALPELELVVEDPIATVVAEVMAEQVSPIDELEAAIGDTFETKATKSSKKK